MKPLKYLILIGIGILSFSFRANAQLEQSVRLEFKVSQNGDEYFDVTPLDKGGILVTQRKEEYYGNEKWTFYRFDNALKQQWTTDYKIPYDLHPLKTYHNHQYLFWLLQETDSEKVSVLRVDLQNGEIETFKGDLLTRADIVHFKVLGNMAFIGGYHHSRPVVMAFSFFDKSIKALPYLYTSNTEISNIELDEKRNQLNVLLYTMKRGNCQFTIKTYSYEGKLLKTTTMPFENNNGLISGKILPLDEASSLIVGNYAQGCTQYSQGLYFSRIKDAEPEKLQWVDFSKLENFFNYLKPKRKQKVVEKISRRKEEGKEPKFRYRLLVHDIVQNEDEFVLVAEVYYPIYKNGTIYYSNMPRNNNREFDGFRYTHAIVCGFDKSGNLLWDNCFALESVESIELLPMVQVSRQEGLLVLGYPKDGKIHTEVIDKNKVIREKEAFEIKTSDEGERIVDNDKGLLAAWYDRYFLAYGYQKIGSEKWIGAPREVFYINKLSYDPSAPRPDKEDLKKGKASENK
ncbi:hypothetical protein P1X15_01670 [Runella sp. MFBS21]|uniref:hypothetical protein n=1 Tax=Runella sp. MFBS21 TaxID=3034018 RepID=UPI0023FA4682|nr:hypothetical protein [Runella sp. MFBS21]MDF7816274.1 hypothetical protein [Runella sp. MFBS21]